MFQGFKIDTNGFLIETVLTEKIETDVIYTEYKGGLYKPKWDGSAWVEGATQDEINKIINIQPQPSLEDRMSALEQATKANLGI